MTKKNDYAIKTLAQADYTVSSIYNQILTRSTDDPVVLKFWDGVWNISLAPQGLADLLTVETEHDQPEHVKYSSIMMGAAQDGDKTLNLVNGNKKIIITFAASYYHQINDVMSSLLELHSKQPDAELIIDVSQVGSAKLQEKEYRYIFSKLDAMKIMYKKIFFSRYERANIDNFFIANHYDAPASTKRVYDFFTSGLDTSGEPFRRVFLSRREQGMRTQPGAVEKGMSVSNDNRIDDYHGLESFFKQLNFEVVTADDFENFEDQIKYFNEAEILVSTTGSGLTNALFMKPNQTVVELLSPLLVTIDGFYQQQLHYFYQLISFRKGHVHVNIPNHSLKVKDLTNLMLNDQYIGALLDPQVRFKKNRLFRLLGRR